MPKGKFREWLEKIASFMASNMIGTVVDTTVLWVFSTYMFDHYVGKYIISPVISFECAVIANFLCSYYFIWRNRVTRHSVGSFFRHYLGYNISCTGVFIIKMGLILLIERATGGWNVVICNLIALCISGLLNFYLGERVIFRKKRIKDARPDKE